VEAPDVQYAKSGDVNIAYQVSGQGPFDLVTVLGFVTHIEIEGSLPTFAPVLEQFSSFSRLIRFDKRGTGMSDRVSGAPTLETRMDDVRALSPALARGRAGRLESVRRPRPARAADRHGRGWNSVLEVRANGKVSTLAAYGARPNRLPIGPPFVESVETAVAQGPDGALYVSELTGAPFPRGFARIHRIGPDGNTTVHASGLTAVVDLAFAEDGALYALQHGSCGPFFTCPEQHHSRRCRSAACSRLRRLEPSVGVHDRPGRSVLRLQQWRQRRRWRSSAHPAVTTYSPGGGSCAAAGLTPKLHLRRDSFFVGDHARIQVTAAPSSRAR
jgi:hypothetical protein